MRAPRRIKMAQLQEAGYQAAKSGLPCAAPTTRELDRAAWEIGWRAGKREMREVQNPDFSDPSNPIRTLIEAAVHAMEAGYIPLAMSFRRAAEYLATGRNPKFLERHEWDLRPAVPGGPCCRFFDPGARR